MQFSKYHGLGNDFIIVDLRRAIANRDADAEQVQDPDVVRQLCDRRRGVGADGVLALLPARPGVDADVRMRVLNADGSEAEMCGNGLRCVGDGSGLFRLPVEVARAGELRHALDLTTTPVIVPGSTWHFQGWYRDPAAGGAAFDLTDGLTVTFH